MTLLDLLLFVLLSVTGAIIGATLVCLIGTKEDDDAKKVRKG